jgi:TonB family protein
MDPEQPQAPAPPPERKKLPTGVLIAIAALGCPFVIAVVLLVISLAGGLFAYLMASEHEKGQPPHIEPAEPADLEPPVPPPPVIDTQAGDALSSGDASESPVRPAKKASLHWSDQPAGTLETSVIKNVIKKHLSSIKYCYESKLRASPTLSGKVTVQFVIGRKGKVVDARIKSSSLGSSEVESCVLKQIRKMKFPKPKGGVVSVSYPFVFTAASG